MGRRVQPFQTDEEAKKITGTNFIVHARFTPHAVATVS
jgi:hypothetical protein